MRGNDDTDEKEPVKKPGNPMNKQERVKRLASLLSAAIREGSTLISNKKKEKKAPSGFTLPTERSDSSFAVEIPSHQHTRTRRTQSESPGKQHAHASGFPR